MKAESRLTENPFYILGLRPGCGRVDVENEGQRLLAVLELGLSSGATYQTPLGPRKRTADMVRQAMAELRDPDKRLKHELWAQLPAQDAAPARAAAKKVEDPQALARLSPWKP
jgi:hypothetical protein